MTQLKDYCKQQKENFHRCFLVYRTDQETICEKLHQPLNNAAEHASCLIVSHMPEHFIVSNKPCLFETIKFSKTRMVLGREFNLVVFDASEGFDPDAFGIATGLVVAGGVFLLILPSSDSAIDKDYSRFIPFGQPAQSINNLFLQHVCKQLSKMPFYQLKHKDITNSLFNDLFFDKHLAPSSDNKYAETKGHEAKKEFIPTQEQKQIMALVDRQALANGPVLITAQRGRGKSALLGAYAAQLLKRGEDVDITAPRVDSILSVVETLKKIIDVDQVSAYHFQYGQASFRFMPLDKAIDCDHATENLLMVDEAAAIPTAVATRLIAQRPRSILTTTTFGYEGSGRAFILRVGLFVKNNWPNAQVYQLHCPVRWNVDDGLECFTDKCLLLSEPKNSAASLDLTATDKKAQNHSNCRGHIGGFDISDTCFRAVEQAELASDHSLLSEVFYLLQQAHYKTSPADLRLLLNAADIRIFIASLVGKVIGVALVNIEGALPEDISQLIFEGKRRVQGHLMAQVIEQQLGHQRAACFRYARIQRIAVDDAFRKNGIGSKLVAYVESNLKNVDIIGSSFGYQRHVTDFWLNNQYMAIKVGAKPSTKAGERSLMVAKSLKTSLMPLVDRWSSLNSDMMTLSLLIRNDILLQQIAESVKKIQASQLQKTDNKQIGEMRELNLMELFRCSSETLFFKSEKRSAMESHTTKEAQFKRNTAFSNYLIRLLVDFGLGYRSLETAFPAIFYCYKLGEQLPLENQETLGKQLENVDKRLSPDQYFNHSLGLIADYVDVSCELKQFIEKTGQTGRKQALLKLRSACKRLAKQFAK
jgi:tRNA(Met) cytidine acetyltransferase